MNKQEILEQIDELKQKIEQIEKEVKSNKDEEAKKGVRQKPEIGEEYYCLTDEGKVNKAIWNGLYRDYLRFDIGNCFKTEQEALSYRENLLTKQALKDLALELNNGVEIDWVNETQKKYCFVYSHNKNKLDYTPNEAWQELGHIYSLDYKFLEVAKDRIGEDKLIKLIKSGV